MPRFGKREIKPHRRFGYRIVAFGVKTPMGRVIILGGEGFTALLEVVGQTTITRG